MTTEKLDEFIVFSNNNPPVCIIVVVPVNVPTGNVIIKGTAVVGSNGSLDDDDHPCSFIFGTRKFARKNSFCNPCSFSNLNLNLYFPFVGIPFVGSFDKTCCPNSFVIIKSKFIGTFVRNDPSPSIILPFCSKLCSSSIGKFWLSGNIVCLIDKI